MNVYVLSFEIGISSGCKDFLGIYDSAEKAQKVLEKHAKEHDYLRCYYSIYVVELNKECDVTYAEW